MAARRDWRRREGLADCSLTGSTSLDAAFLRFSSCIKWWSSVSAAAGTQACLCFIQGVPGGPGSPGRDGPPGARVSEFTSIVTAVLLCSFEISEPIVF